MHLLVHCLKVLLARFEDGCQNLCGLLFDFPTVKINHYGPYGLATTTFIPDKIWEDLSLDFFIGLPLSQGKTVVMVFVD